MLSDKNHILRLTSLLTEHGVEHVVVTPGQRTAPISHTLIESGMFKCHRASDSRAGAFAAAGLARHGSPVVLVCESGQSLAEALPAVTEAAGQSLPLVVVSCDGCNYLGDVVRTSVCVGEDDSDDKIDRLVNMALLETSHRGRGPVLIQMVMDEPLYRFSSRRLPEVRVVRRYEGLNKYNNDYTPLIRRISSYKKRMVLTGQYNLIYLYRMNTVRSLENHFVWLAENIANHTVPARPIRNFDTAVYAIPREEAGDMAPDLLITYGGEVFSASLKKFLRDNPPKEHWHISEDGCFKDSFGCLTTIVEMNPFEFWERVAEEFSPVTGDFPDRWRRWCARFENPVLPFSAMSAVGCLIECMEGRNVLHLDGHASLRYAQMFDIPVETEVCANCGMAGLSGALPSAMGYAAASDNTNYLIVGDVSFNNDMNALWACQIPENLRVMVLNNSGAGQLRRIPGVRDSLASRELISGTSFVSARAWAQSRDMVYMDVHDEAGLCDAVGKFVSSSVPALLEVWTDPDEDARVLREWLHGL